MSPRYHVLGRETFLAPVEWVDGWPHINSLSIDVETRPPGPDHTFEISVRDDFNAGHLHPRWMAVRRPPADIASLTTRPEWLTLFGGDATLDSTNPVFIGRRQQHQRCQARVLVDAADAQEAGLAVLMDEHFHYEVGVAGDRVVVRARIGPMASVVAEAPKPVGNVVLFIKTAANAFGPDSLALGFEDATGKAQVLASLDGRFLSTEVAGGMQGRVLGMYAVGGTAAFEWFDYEELERFSTPGDPRSQASLG